MNTSSKFAVNKSTQITTEELNGSKIWVFDNFYQNPDEVKDFILSKRPYAHKSTDSKTWNKIHFLDLRHDINVDVSHVYDFLKTFSNQVYLDSNILSNCSKFLTDSSFNSYKTHYWWPHLDYGYTGIVYLNDDNEYGTNLYELKHPENYPADNINDAPLDTPEHWEPWREKYKYKLLKTLKPKYNRCILFDAKKFLHGQHVAGERYFHDEFRLNQVFFFCENPPNPDGVTLNV